MSKVQRNLCGATLSCKEDGDYVIIRKDNFEKCLTVANKRYDMVRRMVDWLVKAARIEPGSDLRKLIKQDPVVWRDKDDSMSSSWHIIAHVVHNLTDAEREVLESVVGQACHSQTDDTVVFSFFHKFQAEHAAILLGKVASVLKVGMKAIE